MHHHRRPLHIPRDSPSHFNRLFQPLIHAQQLFDTVASQGPGNALYFKHQMQQRYHYPPLAFCGNASVVINRADKFSAQLHSLCTSLQTVVPFAYCQIYLTPPNSQTVCAHSDDRDVLLLQVLGQKLWRIYDAPVPLPYKHEEVGKTPERPHHTRREDALLQALVSCGDTLYIPRGFVHEGTASEVASMHITVALQTSDWDYVSLITRAVECCLQQHFPARQCPFVGGDRMSSGDALDSALPEETELKFRSLCQEALGRVSLARATALFNERMSALRQERDVEATDNVSYSSHVLLDLNTRIVWNSDVHIDWQQQQQQQELETGAGAAPSAEDEVVILCKFTRRSSGQNALLSASPQLSRVLSRAFSLSQPFTIGSIDASTDMFRICAAKLMLNNGYCLLAGEHHP
jgi:hypothetical protein